jgi:hypothetical protein
VSFFISCKELSDCDRKPVDKITVTGKVVYEDNSPVSNSNVQLKENVFMTYSMPIQETTTNKSGEFTLEFSPRQDVESWCNISYTVECKKECYYQETSPGHEISKHKSKQDYKILLKKQITCE